MPNDLLGPNPEEVRLWLRFPPLAPRAGPSQKTRFGMYMPPLLEELGLAEVSHDARNNRMRAI
jgi:hypothetical protein